MHREVNLLSSPAEVVVSSMVASVTEAVTSVVTSVTEAAAAVVDSVT